MLEIKNNPTLVFFGSGPVAAKALELLAKDFTIEAVITKPQPPHHKNPFPVLVVANHLDVPVLTPSNKSELTELFKSKPVKSTLGVVIDYGIIIAQEVIDYFPLGIVNSHFSLLPKWRGADPISFSILNGDTQTGISVMLIAAGLDTGPLLAQTPYEIPSDCTTPELTDTLIELSNESLRHVLPLYVNGQVQPAPQETVTMAEDAEPTYSRKLTKQDGVLDFSKPAAILEREIRAFLGWPRSKTKINDTEITITKAHVSEKIGEVGTVWHGDAEFGFFTSEGLLIIDRLIPAGKKEMSAAAFLAGYRI